MASRVKDVIRVLPSSIIGSSKERAILKQLKKVDPNNRYVVVFPDSRNVFPGMGINLLDYKQTELIYEKASDIAKIDVLKLCSKPNDGELTSSLRNEYIAAYVTSHATMAKFGFERPHDAEYCKGIGGIGIGLLNSLVYGGVMSFEDGLDLLLRYSQAMQKTANIIPNSRLIVKLKPGTNRTKVCQAAIEHCLDLGIPEEIAVCSIASHIRQQLIIYAGHEEAIKYIETEGQRLFDFWEARRDKRTIYAYHSHIMKPASQFIKGYINDKLIKNPNYIQDPKNCSVYSSISGKRLRCSDDIINDLNLFPIRPVLIESMLQSMYKRPDDIPQPNSVVPWDSYILKTLSKINRKAWLKAKLLPA